MIVVTGATGGLGSGVLRHLLTLVPPTEIIVSLFNPSGAPASITSSGCTIRQASYTDPASLDSAWAGADKLLIVSYPGISQDTRVAAHKSAIDAAVRLGIKHVYYTSLGFGTGLSNESVAAVMQAHLRTEAYLKESGLTWTVIREGIYQESWPLYLGFWAKGEAEAVVPTGDGKIAWVSREDLGEGTAKILAESAYPNQTVFFSGPETLSLAELAALITRLSPSSPVSLRLTSIDDYVQRNTGKPGRLGEPEFLRQWATTYEALGKGECAVVDGTLEKVLGRKSRRMEEFLAETVGEGDAVARYAK